MLFVSPTTANFVVQYASRSRIPTIPPTDAMFTIAPDCRASMLGRNTFETLNTPRTLTAYSASRSAPVVVTMVPTCPIPALFTSTSSRPSVSITSCATAWQVSSFVTSSRIASARPPSRAMSCAVAAAVSGLQIGREHAGPCSRQRLRDGCANSGSGAGHERDLARQIEQARPGHRPGACGRTVRKVRGTPAGHISSLVFRLIDSFPRMQAFAECIACSGPHASGVWTRTAAQKREIS